MGDAAQVFFIIDVTILIIIEILCWIYLLTIVLVKRFHTVLNILTGNVCLSAILCGLFWIFYNISSIFYRSVFTNSAVGCVLNLLFSELVNSLLIYALTMITINRYLTLLYPNNTFFKRKLWAFICAVIQWMFVFILCIPRIVFAVKQCVDGHSYQEKLAWYSLIHLVLLPSFINGIFNILIFLHVRASTRRVHAATTISPPKPLCHQQNARDLYLLKHMLFMFIVFIVGWGPIYLTSVINENSSMTVWLSALLQVLPVISSLITVLDLFWYNHDLRRCLQERMKHGLRLLRHRH